MALTGPEPRNIPIMGIADYIAKQFPAEIELREYRLVYFVYKNSATI